MAPPILADGGAGGLRIDLNLITLMELPEWSAAPRERGPALLAALRAAGYAGVQGADAREAAAIGMPSSTSGRILAPADMLGAAQRWQDEGHACATLHVGTGFEDDPAMDRLAEAVIAAADRLRFPLFIETHRATMTQDMQRTLALVGRWPDLRFNADLSHWYTGQELRYGGLPIEPKLDRLEPVFARVGFMHGRIGTGGCIQVAVDPGRDAHQPWFGHWRALWGRVFAAFRRHARPGEVLPFAPELLPASKAYARCFRDVQGCEREESDRWRQALVLADLARRWWAEQTGLVTR